MFQMRYLVHAMRTAFEMPGTPVRVNLRSTKNPYTD
jgi:predicted GTPase